MPLIRVHTHDFDLLPAGLTANTQDVEFSRDELLNAIVTVGKSQEDDLRTRTGVEECRRELVWRQSLLEMALSESGGRFVQSGSYSRLDPSEKVGVSYMLGLTATNALCLRYLSMPFLMHLDVYANNRTQPNADNVTSEWLENLRIKTALPDASDKARLQAMIGSKAGALLPRVPGKKWAKDSRVQQTVCEEIFGTSFTSSPDSTSDPHKQARFWSFLTRLVRNARPDLFGVQLDSNGQLERCVIAEAKGRSGPVNAADRVDCDASPVPKPADKFSRLHGEAMLQALSRSHVNGVRVGCHLAVFAYFERGTAGGANKELHFSWKDPSESLLSPEERKKVPLGKMVVDYYSSLMALGCPGTEFQVAGERVELSRCPVKFEVADAGFSVEFHPKLHEVLVRVFQGETVSFTEAETIPLLIRNLESDQKIGEGTGFSINALRITGKRGWGSDKLATGPFAGDKLK